MEGLIAITAAIIGVLPPLLVWGSGLTLREKRHKELNELKTRIEVIEAWSRVRQTLADGGDDEGYLPKVKLELDKLFMQYNDVLKREQSLESVGFGEIGVLRRAFLLYASRNNRERMLHIAFYGALVVLSFFMIGISIPGPGAEPSLKYLYENASALIGIIPFAIILLSLQQAAENVRVKLKENDGRQ